MKNSAGRGGCYPLRPKAEVDKTLRDLQNSLYSTKGEFNNNCFIYFLQNVSLFKLVNLLAAISLFVKKHNLIPRFSWSMVQ